MGRTINKRIQAIAVALIGALSMLPSACTVSDGQQGDPAARAASLDADIDRALSQLAQQASGSEQLVASAKGLLVFPTVLSAGLGIGGSHGLGGLRRDGKTVRHYRMTAASVGLLAGARSKTVVYLFMTDEALRSFEASSGWTIGADASVTLLTVGANAQIDTQSARQPVVGFALTNAGLMGNLSMDGTRIAPTTL
jgi:lipid-binding SYLF domain-containing protein